MALALLALVARHGWGNTYSVHTYWANPGTGNWSNADNWTAGEPASVDYPYINNGGTAQIDQMGESCQRLRVGCGDGASGAVEMSAGSLAPTTGEVGCEGGAGSFTLSGGVADFRGSLWVGIGGSGTVNQTGGTLRMSEMVGEFRCKLGCVLLGASGGAATYNLKGGTLELFEPAWGPDYYVTVAVGILGGPGTLNLGDANGTGSIRYIGSPGFLLRLRVAESGTVRGWGTIEEFPSTLFNHGRVIADGYGTDRALDLSCFSRHNVRGNGGWYAQDHGRLLLAPIEVATGNHSYCWGDCDGAFDVVNSVKLHFAGVTRGGPFSIDLLAPDHGAVPAGTRGAILGVWDFDSHDSGIEFASAGVTVRYDDAAAVAQGLAEEALRLYHFDDVVGDWLALPTSVDTTKKWLHADGITSFSLLAAGAGVTTAPPVIPEPSGVALLGLASVALLRRRRRR